MKKAWKNWMKISKKVVSIEASVFFGIIFILIVTPISVVLRILKPDIFLGSGFVKKEKSLWSKIPNSKQDLEFARKQ